MSIEEIDLLEQASRVTAEKIRCPSCAQENQFIASIGLGVDLTKKANVFLLLGYVSIFLFFVSIGALTIISFVHENGYILFTDIQINKYNFLFGTIIVVTFLYLFSFIALLEILRIPFSSCAYLEKLNNKFISLENVKEKILNKYVFNHSRLDADISPSLFLSDSYKHKNGKGSFYGDGNMNISGVYEHTVFPIEISGFYQCPNCKKAYNVSSYVDGQIKECVIDYWQRS